MMKKITFLCLFLFALYFSKSNEIEFDYIVGKIIKLNGDTLITKIHLTSLSGNIVKKLYIENFGHYLDEKNKVRGLNANKINGFEVMVDSVMYKFYTLNKTFLKKKTIDKRKFYHLLNNKNSTLELYEYFNTNGMLTGAAFGVIGVLSAAELLENEFVIKYNNDVIYHPNKNYFKDGKLGYILSDNKELSQKIKDGIYTYNDIPKIIDEYNKWYEAK